MRAGNSRNPIRLKDGISEADILRVDFPGGPMRWRVTVIEKDKVTLRTMVNGSSTSIDREYLRHLMRGGQVRRETPLEMTNPSLIKES